MQSQTYRGLGPAIKDILESYLITFHLAPHDLNLGRLAGFRFTSCTSTFRAADDTALYGLLIFFMAYLALVYSLWHSVGEELFGFADLWT